MRGSRERRLCQEKLMAAKSNTNGTGKLLLTERQRAQLLGWLHQAAPCRRHADALDHLDQVATQFSNDIQHLGFRPSAETMDLCWNSGSFERKYFRRLDKLSPAEREADDVGTKEADRLLSGLVDNVAQCWKEATGSPLPAFEPAYFEWIGDDVPTLALLAASHPLWLIFDAVGLKLSSWGGNILIWKARKRAGEDIEDTFTGH
jgi:hypothetical protein